MNIETLKKLYGEDDIRNQVARYDSLRAGVLKESGTGGGGAGVRFFSAPGRMELAGNHTDHNGGRVIAAAVHLDAVAAVLPRSDNKIIFRSTGFPDAVIDCSNLEPRAEERGTTEALLRGVAAGFREHKIQCGGWTACADSTVLPGSGLSSSAALEVLAAKIIDSLYGGNRLSAPELAKIGRYAENVYYGKPSGLMDQAASAHGGVVVFDFSPKDDPVIERLNFDPSRISYTLFAVNTGGSHAGLTEHYAACGKEMNSVAEQFGKKSLIEVGPANFYDSFVNGEFCKKLRAECGDRALLRALHFFNENARVDILQGAIMMLNDMKDDESYESLFNHFLDIVNACGDSSWQLLQNCYIGERDQGIPLAITLTRHFGRANNAKVAARLQGGGFAGTIQAYVPYTLAGPYADMIEAVFGEDAITPVFVRGPGVCEIPSDIT